MSAKPKYVCNCPFYLGEGKKGIWCEGLGECQKTIIEFANEAEKIKYIKKHCYNICPENCAYFRYLMEKWEAR